MSRCVAAILVLGLPTAAVPADHKARIKPQHVVIVEGTRPAGVKEKDLVRIVQTAVAGSEIKARIAGPGKIASTAYVRRIANGEPVTSSTVKEYVIKPSGPGTIRVTITVVPPSGKDAKEQQYLIEVE
jgi:hypothetical protein